MTIYFTADLHLHHQYILRYAKRNPPFRDIDDMDRELIRNWNSATKNTDKIYHLGDFCFTHDSNVYGRAIRKLYGRRVFLRGNHDQGLQHADYYIWCWIDGMKIFMRHWPPWYHSPRFPHHFDIPFDVDLILCF